MKQFVVFEVWHRSYVVESESLDEAIAENEPAPVEDLSLSNWHVVSVEDREVADGI